MSDLESKLKETRQKILELGDGNGIPVPEKLSDSERQKYESLKSHYIELKNMSEAESEGLNF